MEYVTVKEDCICCGKEHSILIDPEFPWPYELCYSCQLENDDVYTRDHVQNEIKRREKERKRDRKINSIFE